MLHSDKKFREPQKTNKILIFDILTKFNETNGISNKLRCSQSEIQSNFRQEIHFQCSKCEAYEHHTQHCLSIKCSKHEVFRYYDYHCSLKRFHNDIDDINNSSIVKRAHVPSKGTTAIVYKSRESNSIALDYIHVHEETLSIYDIVTGDRLRKLIDIFSILIGYNPSTP